jgi:KipI family sensor histidine kinase inhibitor
MGDAGLLVSDGGARGVPALLDALRRAALPGVRDLVAAASSVLVVLEDGAELETEVLERALTARGAAAEGSPRVHELRVRYDGEDLGRVAERAGLSREELIARHSGAEYAVAFVGFRPGFPDLRGLPPELATPRLATPRPRVAAGRVAIGASWCGIYPGATPGGWNLIGTTDAVLFDPARAPAALFAPGDRIRFVPC